MAISRRDLLIGSAAAYICPFALCQEGAPFAVELPPLPLDLNLPTYAAVDTSGYTNCQVRVLDENHHLLLQSTDWGTEPDRPNGARLQGKLAGEGEGKYVIRVAMRPTRNKTPSVAMAIHQGGDEDLPAVKLVALQDEQQAIERLKNMARQARFVDDPAHLPGGHFTVDLMNDASVFLQIWKGEAAQGAPLYQKGFANVPTGRNPIGWNLQTTHGKVVAAGRYFATLMCSPTHAKLHPTILASYFEVMTGRA